jgi:succinate dehydrogenase hydrophobic anchor subunit
MVIYDDWMEIFTILCKFFFSIHSWNGLDECIEVNLQSRNSTVEKHSIGYLLQGK